MPQPHLQSFGLVCTVASHIGPGDRKGQRLEQRCLGFDDRVGMLPPEECARAARKLVAEDLRLRQWQTASVSPAAGRGPERINTHECRAAKEKRGRQHLDLDRFILGGLVPEFVVASMKPKLASG